MKIVHVITRLIIGGAQENTLLTCAGLAERGHDVILISGTQTGPEGSLWDEAARLGIRTVPLPSLVRQVAPPTDWRCARQLRSLFTDLRPDVVHTHSSKAGILGRWASKRKTENRKPNVVHTIHGMSFNRTQSLPVRTLYRFLERRAARWTDAFISVADAMTDQAVAAGIAPRDRFTTIYSGMRTDRFGPDPAMRARLWSEWRFGADDVVVGTVARLFRNKGYESILDALPLMLSECPNLRFVWVGDGRHRQRYCERLSELGYERQVRLAGLVPPERIPELLAGFDILLHASLWEGLPRAAVQALLTEVPVVVFDLDGSREVVQDGITGRLVTPGDHQKLAAAVVELARDPHRRHQMGQTGRQQVLERFDWRSMAAQIEALYASLLPSRDA